MKKILITNNSHVHMSLNGGYAKQIYYLFKMFREFGFELHYLFYVFNISNNESFLKQYTYSDFEMLRDSNGNKIELINDELLKSVKYYSAQDEDRTVESKKINDIIQKYDIDMFLCLGDAFVFRNNKENSYCVPSYYWFPCHYFPFCNYDYQGINSFSNILSLSPSLKLELEKQFPNKNVYYLPHIVECPILKLNKNDIRQKWNIPNDKYVVLIICNLFHEQQDSYVINRKSIDTQIIAFNKFNEKYSNSLLFLHSATEKGVTIYPIDELIEKLKFTKENFIWNKKGLNEIELHELYEMSDTFLNCTKGEGFGVPILEAQTHNINVITNNFTSMKEHNFQDNIVEPSTISIHYSLHGNWISPSTDNLKNIIEKLYLNSFEKNKKNQNRSKWITNEITSYNNIKNKLYKIIKHKI